MSKSILSKFKNMIVNTIISEGVSSGTNIPASTDTAGAVKPDGSTIQVTSDGSISVPIAKADPNGNPGLVKPDGDTITVDNNGIIRATASSSGSGITAPSIATKITAGIVKFDDDTIKMNSNNQLYANITVPEVIPATTNQAGIVKPDGNTIKIKSGSTDGTIEVPTANGSSLGLVKAGTNITIASGSISVATANGSSTLGVVKAGTNVTIASGAVSVATAKSGSNGNLGVVKPDGTTITVDSSGIIAVPTANGTSTLGLVKAGTNVTISSGVVNVAKAVAGTGSSGTLGVVKPDGTTISIDSNGTISASSGNKTAAIPVQAGTLIYNGSEQSPVFYGYDPLKMTISGIVTGTNAESYNATFTLKSGYTWSDNTTSEKTVSWSIQRKIIPIPVVESIETYDPYEYAKYGSYDDSTPGGTKSFYYPKFVNYIPARASSSWNLSLTYKELSISGDTEICYGIDGISAFGLHTLNITPTDNYMWPDGTTTTTSITYNIPKVKINITNMYDYDNHVIHNGDTLIFGEEMNSYGDVNNVVSRRILFSNIIIDNNWRNSITYTTIKGSVTVETTGKAIIIRPVSSFTGNEDFLQINIAENDVTNKAFIWFHIKFNR